MAPDCLEVTCRKGHSPGFGFATRFSLKGLGRPNAALRLHYDVLFPDGFEFVLGGKLPGLKPYDNPLGARRSYRPMWRCEGRSEL